MDIKLLTEHRLECLSLKGGCRGSSESILVKMSNCWKFHAAALNLMSSFGYPLGFKVLYYQLYHDFATVPLIYAVQ